ncbi:translation initiation factor IF-2 [Stanieria cyanosphaera PCC 7437]|uniref:Translation initiation factor IF-2 n=1 Tax=Stanieria cyanosphaera (strain ATCC 29371 / PCC 7437) TaxID=111780 RepID=K9XX67_STAC7|nr:translation initiation factor IF-2 [Stanieria cyanosphaera]AFZ37190.1 translation initiation factor IF-2 [Stanieria cyanosphaera PCC 7437]
MNNGKVRIYELSKELNLDNKDIKDLCEKLNIAVKSHSSTITESQAERVRTAATKYVPEKTVNESVAHEGDERAKDKLKQQILAIHHKQNLPYSASQSSRKESNSVLAEPPKLLAKPQAKSSNPPTSLSSSNPTQSQLKQPPKPTLETNSPAESVEKTVVERPTAAKPKLVSPPSRPQLVKAPARDAQKQASSKPVAPEEEIASPELKVATPEKTVNKAKAKIKSQPSLPKLQRPQPPKPVDEIKEEVAVTAVDEEVAEETEEFDLDSGVKKEKKLKLKRPDLPRKGKTADWEEEEEEESLDSAKAGKAKTANKAKRRPKPLVDDDDDDFDTELDSSLISTAVSLATARPARPKSLEKQPVAATANKVKKPTQKTEKAAKVDKRDRAVVTGPPESVVLSHNLTVRELADLLNTPETDIIKSLFFKGIAVNITQSLELETARAVAEELGVKVETPEIKSAAAKETEMLDAADLDNLQTRPPVVTIMGHVDHGKTTLLDSIRQSKVAQGEAGGITQHIGAYHVDIEHNGNQQQIVFLDTPGHEAFTAMRARGTRVTDIAILVVAADDGVQPQTREAISHAKAAEVPIIVAINKIDKPESNPERIKQELTELGLVAEDWGGDTIMVPVSALKGENLDNLLEMILLVAEIEELSANPDRLAKGTVIESNLDRARGPVATLLVQNGTLRVGDNIVAGSVFGKIRAMVGDRGNKVEAATPSFAVEVLGLNDVPEAGDEFDVYPTEKEARVVAEARAEQQRDSRLQQAMSSRRITLSSLSAQAQEGELKELNLILKADVHGSVEAILGSLQQLPQNEVQLRILLAAPGEVTETDVDLAAASGAVIIGFNTTLASGSRQAADREGVDIRQYNIIYKLLDDIQGAMEGLLDPEEVEEPLGQAQVRAVFPVGRGTVAGCYVQSGKMVRNAQMRVRRGNAVIYTGVMDSLKRVKEDAKEVNAGYECGIGSSKFNDWQEGDIIEAYEMVFKRRTLSVN